MADVTEVRAFLDAGGASYGAEYWVLFHGAVGFDGDGPIEICVPYDGLVAPAGSIGLREEPAHTVAYVPVTAADCRYPQIIGAYVALETWLARAVAARRSAVREIYPVPWSDDGVVVHVAQPVRLTLPLGQTATLRPCRTSTTTPRTARTATRAPTRACSRRSRPTPGPSTRPRATRSSTTAARAELAVRGPGRGHRPALARRTSCG